MTAAHRVCKIFRGLTIVAIFVLAGGSLKGQLTSAIQTANGPSFTITQFLAAGQGCNVGWQFSVTSLESLTSLGIYDAGADGLSSAHEVGLWDSNGTLLTSTTIPAGTGATLSGSYRYVFVTPLLLSVGETYTVGALEVPDNLDAFIALSSQTYAPGISYIRSVQTFGSSTPTFSRPDTGASVDQGIFGPTFQFITVVPEPSSWALLGLGSAGLGGVIVRRRFRGV